MTDPAAAAHPPAHAPGLAGARWALGLGAALLVAFACLTVARFLRSSPAAVEETVQVPVVAAVPTPTPAVLAPDPGDNP